MIFRRSNRSSCYTRLYPGGRERWISPRTDSRREAEARAARLKYSTLPDVIRAVATPLPMPLADLWADYARTADLKPLAVESYHRIFDLFCRWAWVNGVPMDDLRAMLGHTTSAMTAHYIDSPEAVRLDLYLGWYRSQAVAEAQKQGP